jgi:hypothetical protein
VPGLHAEIVEAVNATHHDVEGSGKRGLYDIRKVRFAIRTEMVNLDAERILHLLRRAAERHPVAGAPGACDGQALLAQPVDDLL